MGITIPSLDYNSIRSGEKVYFNFGANPTARIAEAAETLKSLMFQANVSLTVAFYATAVPQMSAAQRSHTSGVQGLAVWVGQ
ncbi:MAG: hypothetical protein KDI79_05880 [Anaerolineae bacterium]|nr:hypothetical protein [Anaerolineae bacterium]